MAITIHMKNNRRTKGERTIAGYLSRVMKMWNFERAIALPWSTYYFLANQAILISRFFILFQHHITINLHIPYLEKSHDDWLEISSMFWWRRVHLVTLSYIKWCILRMYGFTLWSLYLKMKKWFPMLTTMRYLLDIDRFYFRSLFLQLSWIHFFRPFCCIKCSSPVRYVYFYELRCASCLFLSINPST